MSFAEKTPLESGFHMPAEWVPHARCWMAWPYRREYWGDDLPETQRAYARVAQAIASFEPVTMIAPSDTTAEAARLCGPGVEIFPLQIDDSWTRDSGPAFLTGPAGSRAATAWHFNAWGGKTEHYAEDAQLAKRLCAHLGFPYYQSSLHLEGGALHVDGEGTVLTTEPCALHANRNPGLTKREVLRENRRALEGTTDAKGRPIEIVEMEDAWEADPESGTYCRSFISFYVANGGVVMPAYDVPGDARARAVVEKAFPDRKVVQVDVRKIAIGGGGIHCITQQQPA